MRIILTTLTGLCSLGSGLGLAIADQPAPQPASVPPRLIAAVQPLPTATVPEASAEESFALPSGRRGAQCRRDELGWLSQDHGTVLVCARTDDGMRWVVAVG